MDYEGTAKNRRQVCRYFYILHKKVSQINVKNFEVLVRLQHEIFIEDPKKYVYIFPIRIKSLDDLAMASVCSSVC